MVSKLYLLSIVVFAFIYACSPGAGSNLDKATFAGGCFWCMEPPFEKLYGVEKVISGYMGGTVKDPTYKQVSSGKSGHVEAVQVWYDRKRVSYNRLLDVFWHQVNPTDGGGQFVDRGNQYRTVIFYHNAQQKKLAEQSKADMEKKGIFGKPIVTEITSASAFYKAESYHQDYYKKNPVRYKFYRSRSGRDQYLKKIWGKKMNMKKQDNAADNLSARKKKLNRIQYYVTQEEGTEKPFDNEYWDNKREGIYVDIVSGEPLFSSLDKYKSGTGWPSFTRPLEPANVVRKVDKKLFVERVEVRSANADSHLGHVFDDGPQPTGLRYCINSASLRFIPREDLEKEGYGKYKKMFEK